MGTRLKRCVVIYRWSGRNLSILLSTSFLAFIVLVTMKIPTLKISEGISRTKYSGIEYYPGDILSLHGKSNSPLGTDFADIAESRGRGETVNLPIVNPHPFKYISNPESLCQTSSKEATIRLLVLVKSTVSDGNMREVIRSTWGKVLKSEPGYRLAFLLGYSPLYQYPVENEVEIYRDIIQENFLDTPQNKTLKIIMAFNWITKFCSNAEVALFLNDDMLVNTQELMQYISQRGMEKTSNLFSGIIRQGGLPVRDESSRWCIFRVPTYLEGSAFLISRDVISKFRTLIPYIKYTGEEDVYLGILAYILKIKLQDNSVINENQNIRDIKNLQRWIVSRSFHNYELYHKIYLELFKHG